MLEEQLEKDKFHVVFESLSDTEAPFQITLPEFMRRMKDMAQMGGGNSYMANFPDQYNLVVNANHPLVVGLLEEKDETERSNRIRQMKDLAMLSQNLLKGQELDDFIKRSLSLIGKS
jgi:molecular chaperone HtpG